MLLYRGLSLATLISAVSIVFADILIPGFTNQYNVAEPYSNVQHVPWSVKSQYPNSPVFSYFLPQKLYAQLVDQHVSAVQPQQATEIQTIHPRAVGSNFVKYSNYPWMNLLPSPITGRRHVSYTKIGGHGYTRPTVIVKYPKPAHYRYRRSAETGTESSKPAIATHADDVAAESALINDELPTFIGSLLPENQLTDTNDKHVTSRQIRNDHAAMKPGLFGLYPKKMNKYRQAESLNEIQQPLLQSLPVRPNTPKQPDEQLPASIIKPTVVAEQAQSTLSMISQEKQLDHPALYQNQQNAYQESDSKLLQESTHVDETKSPKVMQTIINSLIPTNDQSASKFNSNILKRELANAQDQYSSHALPWVKNLEDTPQIKIDESPSRSLPSLTSLPDYKKETYLDGTESFTNNWLNYVPQVTVPVPTQPWLLFKTNKNKGSEDFSNYLSYRLAADNSDNYSDGGFSFPVQRYFDTYVYFPFNNNPSANCVTYKISDTQDNMNPIYVS